MLIHTLSVGLRAALLTAVLCGGFFENRVSAQESTAGEASQATEPRRNPPPKSATPKQPTGGQTGRSRTGGAKAAGGATAAEAATAGEATGNTGVRTAGAKIPPKSKVRGGNDEENADGYPDLADEKPTAPRKRPIRPVSEDPAEEAVDPDSGDPVPPRGEPLRVKKLSPEVEELLKDWEFHSSQFQTLEGKHHRWVYDNVFNVEKRSEGNFAYEAPDRGVFEARPAEIAKAGPESVSKKKTPDGTPYGLVPDQQEHWVCTGEQVLNINHKEKQYNLDPVPAELRGKRIVEGPLPFVFGMKAEYARTRYDIEIVKHEKSIVTLKVVSRLNMDRGNWQEAYVQLDQKTFLPVAVKLVHAGRTSETIYKFEDVKINEPITGGWFKRNPFDVASILRNYKRALSAEVEMDGSDPRLPPTGKSNERPLERTADARNDDAPAGKKRSSDTPANQPGRNANKPPRGNQ